MIVISHQEDYATGFPEVRVVGDLDAALELAKQSDCEQDFAFVIGGAAIYELALPRAEWLYFSRIHAEIAGDVLFPAVDWSQWQRTEESQHTADEFDEYDHTFSVYQKKKA